MRGTSDSALEALGFHAHILASHCTSPRLAQAMLMAFVYRWNQRIKVNNRGGVAFVHNDLELMHHIHCMECKVCADTESDSLMEALLESIGSLMWSNYECIC